MTLNLLRNSKRPRKEALCVPLRLCEGRVVYRRARFHYRPVL